MWVTWHITKNNLGCQDTRPLCSLLDRYSEISSPITKVHQAMASEEFEPMSQKMVAKTAAKIPDYLVDFVKFKRETVRLDYTAERLRSACRKVEKQREEMVAKLKEEEDSITVQAMECQKRRLEDDQKTLEIQTMAREMAERKRVLQQEGETSQSLIKELIRKKNKLQHWLQELEERRAFLSQIIGHKVSPRTPSSARRGSTTTARLELEDQVVEALQNPGLIRSRLSQKEHNVIAQAQMIFQSSQLTEQCPPPLPDELAKDEDDFHDADAISSGKKERSMLRNTTHFQSALSDQVFSTVHRMHRRFVSSKSSSCDAMQNFAELERYALYVLQLVDSCEPAMLKKIIAKVVLDKKRTFEQEKLAQTAKIRAEREHKAQLNAFSAPAQFQRAKPQAIKLKKRAPVVRHIAEIKTKDNGQSDQPSADEDTNISTPSDQQLLYLFRLQL